ncbi:MAG: hypothetical protein RIS76_2571, partial [Verrucomicrobiota bacterium]
MGRQHFLERGRTAAIFGLVVPSVPGAGDASIHDAPLTHRPALVAADVGSGEDSTLMTKQRDPFTADDRHP